MRMKAPAIVDASAVVGVLLEGPPMYLPLTQDINTTDIPNHHAAGKWSFGPESLQPAAHLSFGFN